MRKTVLTILLLFLVTVCTCGLAEQSGTVGDIAWTLDENGLLTLTGSGPMDDCGTYNGSPWFRNQDVTCIETHGVTRIGSYAFYGCGKLTEVRSDGALEELGDGAFSNCKALTAFDFPSSLHRIECTAFAECGFEEITVPKTVTWIEEGAFMGGRLSRIDVEADNPGYTSVDGILYTGDMTTLICYPPKRKAAVFSVPEGVTRIGDYAFRACNNLLEIHLPESLTAIGDYSFSISQRFSSIHIPQSVNSIGAGAFNITGIEEIVIPDGITVIAEGLCAYSDHLQRVILPGSVTEIGPEAFAGCFRLVSVNLPDGLKHIGFRAFAECDALPGIDLPDRLEYLGEGTFESCTVLQKVHIPSGLSGIEPGTFRYCIGLTAIDIPAGVRTIGDEAFQYCISLTRIGLREGLESVGDRAFQSAAGEPETACRDVFLPFSLTDIGEDAFEDASVRFICPRGSVSEKYAVEHDLQYLTCHATTLSLPEQLETIETEAFAGLEESVNIRVPASVRFIDDTAFADSSVLLLVLEDTFAEQWADAHEIPYLGI